MNEEKLPEPTERSSEVPKEPQPGYLILKMKDGQGVMVSDDVEIRLCQARNNKADIAIRAPRHKRIRRIPD